MSNNKKLAVIVLVILAVVLIIAGVMVGIGLTRQENPGGPSEYSAVYLSTGDIYFGKLSWFPSLRLANVWFIQRNVGQDGQQLSVAPFASAFWGPVDEIYLNPKDIVFWTRLRNDSQIVKALTGQNAAQNALQGQPQIAPPQSQQPPVSTSTSQGSSSQPSAGKKNNL